MSKKLYILGKSNYALAIIFDILKLTNNNREIIIVRNLPDNENSSHSFSFDNGIPYKVINLEEFEPKPADSFVIGSIGRSRMRIKNFFEANFPISTKQYLNLIHPSAVVADSVELGSGIHVGPLSVIAPFAQLDNHCTVNRNVSIGHHTILEDFACINPGVTVAGLCSIGKNTLIGAGSTIIDKIIVESNSIVGAGSLVTKNIGENVVAYGSPAKIIRNRTGLY